MTDSVALRKAVSDSGLKYNKIAGKMGITPYSLQKKIDNETEFKASEIVRLSELLCLSEAERSSIFFAKEVIYNHALDGGEYNGKSLCV